MPVVPVRLCITIIDISRFLCYYVNYRRCFTITNEGKLQLMKSKLRAFQHGYLRAVEKEDEVSAGKWLAGYKAICVRMDELKED
ncbi:hypothetical protein SDC9_108565 [bioreactor metagenome]|uniref:Uncharacterized protein n=1 Tax=bioreactor metagenome TaxID=1076179 RepID=A0A645B8G5_9ZZZZ